METRNSSMMVVLVIVSLVLGGVIGYIIGAQQGAAKAMVQVQPGATDTTANGMGTTTDTASSTTAPMESSAVQPTSSTTMMSVSLATQNDSGQSGTATLTEENGQVKVVLSMTGGTFTDPQPAHIHMGSCPTPGSVVYPLSNVVNGKSETMLDTTMADLKAKGALAVNIHKSSAESSVYTACGDLK